MIEAGTKTFTVDGGACKPELGIWVPVPQTQFVGQASCTNITVVLSFQCTKLF